MSEAFARWFESRIGAAFGVNLGCELSEVEAGYWTNGVTVAELPILARIDDVPEGAVLAGCWGRGMSSEAFYLIDARGPHRRFFRLSLGNAYGDPEEDKQLIARFLAGYEGWRKVHEDGLSSSTIVHDMGTSRASMITADGDEREAKSIDDDAFWGEVHAALA